MLGGKSAVENLNSCVNKNVTLWRWLIALQQTQIVLFLGTSDILKKKIYACNTNVFGGYHLKIISKKETISVCEKCKRNKIERSLTMIFICFIFILITLCKLQVCFFFTNIACGRGGQTFFVFLHEWMSERFNNPNRDLNA